MNQNHDTEELQDREIVLSEIWYLANIIKQGHEGLWNILQQRPEFTQLSKVEQKIIKKAFKHTIKACQHLSYFFAPSPFDNVEGPINE